MLGLLLHLCRGLLASVRYARFPFEELVAQTWYTIRVCTLPALAVSIPFGVVLALQVGVLAQQVGAGPEAGAFLAAVAARRGSVAVPARANPASARLRLHGPPRVQEADTGGFVVRASLARA